MMNQDGFTTTFNYEGNELRGISYAPPADPNIADGHGYTGFEKEGNKIIVKRVENQAWIFPIIRKLNWTETDFLQK